MHSTLLSIITCSSVVIFFNQARGSFVAIFSQSSARLPDLQRIANGFPEQVFPGSMVEYGDMSTKFGSTAIAAAILFTSAGIGLQGSSARAADDCLAAPNSHAPQGSHWHYRTDRVKQRKCWYLRSQDQAAEQSEPQAKIEAAPNASAFAAQPIVAVDNASPGVPAQVSAFKPPPAIANVGVVADNVAKAATEVSAQQGGAANAEAATTAVKWPDPAPTIPIVKSEGPAASPAAAPADSAPRQVVSDVQVADAAAAPVEAPTTQPTPEPSTAPGNWTARLTATPTGIFLIVAIALAIAGILSRAVIRIAFVRRHRVYVDKREQDWLDYIPPEHAPSIAVRPADVAQAPAVRLRPNENELESALRQFMRDRDSRTA
jgi:hypothetical protein